LITVIAVGNPYRCDDGVGMAVLACLAEHFATDPRVRLVELDGEPVRLMQAWEGSAVVWLIDAMSSGEPPGSVREFDALVDSIERHGARLGGGHALGVTEAVDLARALDRLPDELRVVGIEGATFDNGPELSPVVADAAIHVGDLLAAAVRQTLSTAAISRCAAAVRPTGHR
jgi:hydrogenase maturation protease